MRLTLKSEYQPAGDQPRAIESLVAGLSAGEKFATLLGVTGSGKTFTMAGVIERLQRPTLILSHNKTLVAQLYRELRTFFPENAVEYFVSYYDYYQPEAYVPATDTYIEKDSSINDEIDRMRLAATSALLDRRDVVIVATVSCIYGLGSPEQYRELVLFLKVGLEMSRKELLTRLVDMQYERNDADFSRSAFRVRGDTIDIHPAYARYILRIEFFGDTIERITRLEPITGKLLESLERTLIYPAKHFVTTPAKLEAAIGRIETELEDRLKVLRGEGKEIEARRLESRTRYDMEMLREVGHCPGIENYSRPIAGREAGERPACLLDYFPPDWLLIVDESHVSLPQIGAMFNGDRARKQTLVDHGFRLPSALDNRPLRFEEFEAMVNQAVHVSATPGNYEREHAVRIVEQVIRPTGLVDPHIEVRPTEGQIDDLVKEIKERVLRHQRVLVTTLTKRMSEDLARYFMEIGIKVRYLHSEIETIERVEILRDLRKGEFDVLVGINLLREGLDLPEVSLVAILDADKVGFLRSTTALIQTVGRAARNVDGYVIMYADRISPSMRDAIDETNRRRAIQEAWNEQHGITPKTIIKAVEDILERRLVAPDGEIEVEEEKPVDLDAMRRTYNLALPEHRSDYARRLQDMMFDLAERLRFEDAARVRDEMRRVTEMTSPKSRGR